MRYIYLLKINLIDVLISIVIYCNDRIVFI
jgi:hypothetical protein